MIGKLVAVGEKHHAVHLQELLRLRQGLHDELFRLIERLRHGRGQGGDLGVGHMHGAEQVADPAALADPPQQALRIRDIRARGGRFQQRFALLGAKRLGLGPGALGAEGKQGQQHGQAEQFAQGGAARLRGAKYL